MLWREESNVGRKEINTDNLDVTGLEFDDATHTYRLDGFEIPSVSAIMEPLSRSKYAHISEEILERAASRGTAIHNSIENWIKFGIEDVPLEYQGYFEAFRKWWEQYKPTVIASEARICHFLMRYGGTVDLLAGVENAVSLIDFKSTSTISDMTCGVQLEAYAKALENIGVKVERKRILHLKKNGEFEYREYPINDLLRWRVFGALKTVYDYIDIQ